MDAPDAHCPTPLVGQTVIPSHIVNKAAYTAELSRAIRQEQYIPKVIKTEKNVTDQRTDRRVIARDSKRLHFRRVL